MTTLTPPDWVKAREYQQNAIDAWLEANAQGILHMATGTGKTVTRCSLPRQQPNA